MKLGIVGHGVVGQACSKGFKALGHEVTIHDISLNTKMKDLYNCEIIYICVPTPVGNLGECDVSIVRSCVEELSLQSFAGLVAIKSTVVPGTTENMKKKFENLSICFVPEFLRERCAYKDFTLNHDLLAVGTDCKIDAEKIIESHGNYPKSISIISSTEAEVLKYFSNVYNATKVIFANNFFEICDKLNADYMKILDSYMKRNVNPRDYLEVSENLRGYGGGCLPKDTKAIAHLARKLGSQLSLFDQVEEDNSNLKTTVFDGMRS